MRILHLSDLHLCTEHLDRQKRILSTLFDDLKKRPAPDVVVFSGDLVRAGEKNEFDMAEAEFFIPLAKAARIERSAILLVPGNHDMNRDEINNYIEQGLERSLKSGEEISRALTVDLGSSLDDRLRNYSDYRQSNFPHCNLQNNRLSTVATFQQGLSVGFALLHSAWRSTGVGESEYGKLLVGDTQIHEALEALSETTVKIAVLHHPIRWMDIREQSRIQNLLERNFHLVLTGHNHTANLTTTTSQRGELVSNEAGCLYESEEYFNSYSFVDLAMTGDELTTRISHRVYYAERHEFDKPTALMAEETYEFRSELDRSRSQSGSVQDGTTSLELATRSITVPGIAGQTTPDSTDESLFRSFLRSSGFIKPRLTLLLPDLVGIRESVEEFDHIQSLENRQNVLIYGHEESGKTTVLAWLLSELIDIRPTEQVLYIDFAGEQTIDLIEHRVRQSMKALGDIPSNLGQAFSAKSTTIAIDNLDPYNTTANEAIMEFATKYSTVQVIASARLDLLVGYYEASPSQITDFEHLRISECRAQEVRQLVHKYSPEIVQIEPVVDRVMEVTSREGMARTPFVVALVILSLDMGDDMGPINRASLIARYVDRMLARGNPKNDSRASFDYDNRINYLIEFAAWLFEQGERFPQYAKAVAFTHSHLDRLGHLGQPDAILSSIVAGGTLIQAGGCIGFRHPALRQYFVGLAATTKPEFETLLRSRPVHNLDELDYSSAVTRKDEAFIKSSLEYLRETRSKVDETVLSNSILPSQTRSSGNASVHHEELLEPRTSTELDEQRNLAFPEISEARSHGRDANHVAIVDSIIAEPFDHFQIAVDALGRATRNAEHSDNRALKREGLTVFFAALSECFIGQLQRTTTMALKNDQLRELLCKLSGLSTEAEKKEATDQKLLGLVFAGVFVTMHEAAYLSIGTTKLAKDYEIVFNGLEDDHPVCVTMMATLGLRLDLPNKFEMIDSVIERHGNLAWVATMLCIFLSENYHTYRSQDDRTRVIRMIADLTIAHDPRKNQPSAAVARHRDNILAQARRTLNAGSGFAGLSPLTLHLGFPNS